MTDRLKSQHQHTIPRWVLENFTGRDGMLHVARSGPRAYFKSRPRNVFRRRDYYAAKEIGVSLEDKVTEVETLFHPHVKNVVRAARQWIDDGDHFDLAGVAEDIRYCGLFIVHLSYRSPQWLGEDFLSGLDALRIAVEETGEDMHSAIGEESVQLWQVGEVVLVLSQVEAPTFLIGDCGPFVSQDSELGVDNEKRRRADPDWVPSERRVMDGVEPGRRTGSRDEGSRGNAHERNTRHGAVSGVGGSFQRAMREAQHDDRRPIEIICMRGIAEGVGDR